MTFALPFILGIMSIAGIMLAHTFILNRSKHWPVVLLNIGYTVILVVMIPFITTEYADTCDILLTNQTEIHMGAVGSSNDFNVSIAYTYDEQCFTSTKTSPSTLYIITMYYILITAMYWFIKLFIWVVQEHFFENTSRMLQNWRQRLKR